MRFLLVSIVFMLGVGRAETLFIRANQLGYRPNASKVAVAFSSRDLNGKFSVIEVSSEKVVFQGETSFIPGKWGKFQTHGELDFSTFKKTGHYVLRVGDAQSLPFNISDEVYSELPNQLLEFMREQRCGYNPWLDAVCHSFDGRTAYGPLTNGTYLNCSGGWHDAGDLLKYLITSANATAQMLLAYELEKKNGATVSDRHNALGQPGANGIPDLLDEAKWGLDWMLKLHPTADTLYHQVADDRDHEGWRLPQNEFVDYGWGAGKERVVYCADGKPQGLAEHKSIATGYANLAGRYAAAMALAYQIWKNDPQMKGYAQTCLGAGLQVYELGQAHEGFQQGNSYKAPYRYEESTWADDMEWGASELYRAVHEKKFLQDAKRYALLAANDTWMGKQQTRHYEFYPFMNAGHFRLYDLVDGEFKRILASFYRAGIEQCLAMAEKNPYRIGVPFIWCSNNLTAALATQCIFYERMTGDTRFHRFAAQQRDWLLGRNPWGTSMFTEIGQVFPKDPHLMTNKLLHRTIRGGLVDGPVYERIFKSLKGVGITEPDPFADFQGELAVYHDDIKDYATNEPTMDGTASAILLWALCGN